MLAPSQRWVERDIPHAMLYLPDSSPLLHTVFCLHDSPPLAPGCHFQFQLFLGSFQISSSLSSPSGHRRIFYDRRRIPSSYPEEGPARKTYFMVASCLSGTAVSGEETSWPAAALAVSGCLFTSSHKSVHSTKYLITRTCKDRIPEVNLAKQITETTSRVHKC